jgi:hypothetical protein
VPVLGPRVSLVRADQSDEAALMALVDRFGRPDVVIDDGSHVGEHILAADRSLPASAPASA